VSGASPQCAQLRRRLRPPRGPHLDGVKHLRVNAPAYRRNLHVDQPLSDGAVKARAVVLMSGRTGHRAIADRSDEFWAACGKLC
jgi:hypothetical protein